MIKNVIYVDYINNPQKLSSVDFDKFKDKEFYIFLDKKIENKYDNVKYFLLNNYNNFPKELSCLMQLLNIVDENCFYYLNFKERNNINLYSEINQIDDDFKFCGNQISDISICFANYKDQVLFSSRNNYYLKHEFPLLIKGDKLKFILKFIRIFLDLNIFNYNIEGIFSIIKKLKYD